MELMSVEGLIALYSFITGAVMIGMWFSMARGGLIKEMESRPIEMRAHILVELLTASLLILSSLLLFLDMGRELSFLALGMLLYTIINSAGYYAQEEEMAMVTMFIVLGVLTMASILMLVFL